MFWILLKKGIDIVLATVIFAGIVGCMATNSSIGTNDEFDNQLEKVDMSGFTIDQFKMQNSCESTSQCKYVPYGKGSCQPYKGYLIYSTAIGTENEGYLLKEVERNREEEILAEKNSTHLEEICTGGVRIAPLLFCEFSSDTCVDALIIMEGQSDEIYRLRRELGIEE